jgi:hypothetical protein
MQIRSAWEEVQEENECLQTQNRSDLSEEICELPSNAMSAASMSQNSFDHLVPEMLENQLEIKVRRSVCPVHLCSKTNQ